MKRIAMTLVLALASCLARAQVDPADRTAPPAEAEVRQWLTGSDPRLEAWAAYWVLKDWRSSLLPDLEAAIVRDEDAHRRIEGRPQGDWNRASVALLDTVIQMKGDLPLHTVAGLGEYAHAQKLILLDRMDWKLSEAIWLELYRPEKSGAWEASRVAAEELARHRSPGFAVQLMRSVVVHGWVQVRDPDSLGMGSGYASGCCLGRGVPADKQVWPATGGYVLLAPTSPRWEAPSGVSVLIGKPDPIYVQRIVSKDFSPNSCGGMPGFSDAIRSHLTGTLLGENTAPFPLHSVTLSVDFAGREDYQRRVESFVEEQQANFRAVGERLTAQGLMTEEERQSLSLRMVLMLDDIRKVEDVELPTIIFREPVVWGSFFGEQ